MKDLRIGKLLFKIKAVHTIAFAFFINGIILGGFIASSILADRGINVLFLIILLLITWIPFYPTISKNVEELP
ncbi:hypothetical protein [Salegentibacter sp. Hel_I_6]|uniref:hypothetical protein n=1 Tax=Salegentibacter sp. Hel_I_6 TaxID=1250278 RepID=UPI00055E058D|nr:hypothetical protein [Salegentibacter sp. Hel_I_6]